MKNFLSPLFILSFCFVNQILYAQSQVNVTPLTGAASMVIPIDMVKRGNVSVPVNLVYYGGGVKPKDVEMNAGMGWQVETGGQVIRQLRGLPDDCKKDQSNVDMLGWIYNTNQSKISSFIPANNGSTCSNETTDISYLNSNFFYTSDTEPDIFNVSAPGLSCQLVWDQSMSTPGFRPIPYQDLVITPSFNATTGAIIGFTIVNDQGIRYVFSNFETVNRKTIIASGASINYFKNTYNQYQNGINFNNNWHLTSVTDANGNGVSLSYTTGLPRSSKNPIILYTGAASGATTRIAQYTIQETITPQTLSTISEIYTDGISPIITFDWKQMPTGQMLIQNATRGSKSFSFSYSSVSTAASYYTRSFLRNFYVNGCSSPVNYRFVYSGESYTTSSGYTTIISDSTSKNIDYWGYYNGTSTDLNPALIVNPSNASYPRYAINVFSTVGSDYTNSLSGTNRSANANYVTAGSLTKVYNASGGNTTIEYESNDYQDVPANTIVQGGGVRVKKIIDSAVNSPVAMVRTYAYKAPPYLAGSPSSGKPVSLPQFAFTTPYAGTATGNDYWNYATIRSETDLSPENHTIMYEYVRETQSGAGSTLTQYYLPAMNWDNTAAPVCASCTAEWAPTMNYAGRTNCLSSYGPVKNYTGSYPFAPNANYDFERGLPSRVSNYDEELSLISEKSYTYQRVSSPVIIPAMEIDNNINGSLTIQNYSKYAIYASAGELLGTETSKIYDAGGTLAGQSATTSYLYNNTQHKLIKQTTTNSDGRILTNNIQYVKDFTATGTNADVVAIRNLQLSNINIPVETYQQVTVSGTTKTTSASLTRFGAFAVSGTTSYLPLQSLKFFSSDGDPLFTPYQITSGTPLSYSGYVPVINYKNYDYLGDLITTDDAHKHTQTTIINHITNSPEATFTNAAINEVAFSDFDSYMYLGAGFALSGTQFNAADSHTGIAVNMSTSQVFSKALTKNVQAANYIFSLWIKAPVGTNSLTLNLTGSSAVTKTYTGTGAWRYYSFPVSMTGVSSSFTFSFSSNVNISVDDLLFYPENSEVTTFNYDPVTQFKVAQTNTNGISAYFTYDNWGRLIYTYDQDRNLVKKNTFITPADLQNSAPPSISIGGDLYSGTAVTFQNSGYTYCTNVGVYSSWDFGDGGTAVTISNSLTSHTYANPGTYTVTLVSTSPLYSTQTVIRSITVAAPPPPTTTTSVTLSYTNYTTSNGSISNVSFNNGVDPVINVSGAQLNGYQIPKSTHPYTITVTLAGGTQYNAGTDTGYGCVYLLGGNSPCKDYDVHNTNTYAFLNFDLSSMSSLSFKIFKTNCANSLFY